jgi:FKBP-type peptidyl-prolyl cis-trans isomerase
MRNVAEFDNYKKRNAKIWSDAFNEGASGVLLKILPVGDSLDWALQMDLDEKTKEGVKVTESGLQYKVIELGKGTEKPTATSTVKAKYKGTTIDGKVFDESKDAVAFPLNGVIRGWTEGLQLFPEGSKFELYIPANLGYGEHSPSPAIPANSVLIFEIELVEIVKPEGAK